MDAVPTYEEELIAAKEAAEAAQRAAEEAQEQAEEAQKAAEAAKEGRRGSCSLPPPRTRPPLRPPELAAEAAQAKAETAKAAAEAAKQAAEGQLRRSKRKAPTEDSCRRGQPGAAEEALKAAREASNAAQSRRGFSR
ncbi:MAG: hypothetical protein ACLU9S_18145 [Oscillospiraceae bacterium]